MAYDVPDRSGVDLAPATVKRIAARCENFVGLKDSTGRLEEMPELCAIGADRPFAVFIGRDRIILEAMRRGAFRCSDGLCQRGAAPVRRSLSRLSRG